MIVYIAGKMANLPDLGRLKFQAAAKKLREDGFVVLNLAELPDGMPGDRYMPICLAMVTAADAVYLLNNWRESPGAILERSFAQYQGKLLIEEARVDA